MCPDEKRDLHGIWNTVDLEDALEVGYVIVKIFEVYHFQKTSKYERDVDGSSLFVDYVNLFLKGKQEASGWPIAAMDKVEQE